MAITFALRLIELLEHRGKSLMNTEIVKVTDREEIQPTSWDEKVRIAKTVAASGLFALKSPETVLTLMLIAEAEHISPIRAMMIYDVVNGRPSMKAQAMLARFQEAGGICVWKETSNEAAEAVFIHPVAQPDGLPVRFTIADAQRMGDQFRNATWHHHPADMLVARVIAKGVRRVLPGVILGFYSPEEIATIPDERLVHDRQPRKSAQDRLDDRAALPPVSQTVTELQAHEETIDQLPERSQTDDGDNRPKSDFRQWVEQEIAEPNVQLTDWGARKLSPMQIGRHILKVSIEGAYVNEEEISFPDPDRPGERKRDKKAEAAVLVALWKEDSDAIKAEVRRYISQKMIQAQDAIEKVRKYLTS